VEGELVQVAGVEGLRLYVRKLDSEHVNTGFL
jgi:hypothetical protein